MSRYSHSPSDKTRSGGPLVVSFLFTLWLSIALQPSSPIDNPDAELSRNAPGAWKRNTWRQPVPGVFEDRYRCFVGGKRGIGRCMTSDAPSNARRWQAVGCREGDLLLCHLADVLWLLGRLGESWCQRPAAAGCQLHRFSCPDETPRLFSAVIRQSQWLACTSVSG